MTNLSTWAEKFLWNNFKMYLLEYPTCLCDNILAVKDANNINPFSRYTDFANQIEQHIGLGSYVVQQATQFSNLPYVTVNIEHIEVGHCAARVAMSFNIVFATDTPSNEDTSREPGNSSEAVAAFRADIISSLDQMMYGAFGNKEPDGVYSSPAFFDALRDQELPNPVKPEQTKLWEYNVVGTVDDEKFITAVHQLKREDRSSGLSVFDVIYHIDINKLYGGDIDCGC